MDVSIKESKFSFTTDYEITTPTAVWTAHKKIFSFTDDLTLQTATGTTLAHITGEFSPLRARHDIETPDGRIFKFWREEIWKGVFYCECGEEKYHLYEHKGLQYSIFKNTEQIAAISKNSLVFGSGNNYEIRMNSDADAALIVSMVLTLNSFEYRNDDNSTVTFDLGKISADAKTNDESWEPR